MRMRLFVRSVVTLTMLSGFAFGQARSVPGFAQPSAVTPGFAGFGVSSTTGFASGFHHRALGNTPVVFFSDLGYEPVSSQPVSVIVVQPPAPTVAPREEEPHPPAKPLLLELQGDRWVQVDQFQMTRKIVPNRDNRVPQGLESVPLETLLIFRDGRAETTSGYAVIGDTLYEQSNYWTSGSWTKKIPIADLDLPATIQANQQRGVAFKLPAGPNEVVLQP